MDNGLSDKKKKNLLFILSQCPKNNLQQHLKGQASKSPPPSPKSSIPLGLGLGIQEQCHGAEPARAGLQVPFSMPCLLAGRVGFPAGMELRLLRGACWYEAALMMEP